MDLHLIVIMENFVRAVLELGFGNLSFANMMKDRGRDMPPVLRGEGMVGPCSCFVKASGQHERLNELVDRSCLVVTGWNGAQRRLVLEVTCLHDERSSEHPRGA